MRGSGQSAETTMMIPKTGQARVVTDLRGITIPGAGEPGRGRGSVSIGRKNSFLKFRKSKKKIG